MGYYRWHGGAGNGNLSDASNFVNLTTGTGATAAPVSGDYVYFEGRIPVTTGGNNSVKYKYVEFGRGFSGTVGSPGSPLLFGAETLIYNGVGDYAYIEASSEHGIDNLDVRGTGSGVFRSCGGLWDNVNLGESGNYTADSNTALNSLFTAGCSYYIDFYETPIDTIEHGGGYGRIARNVTEATVAGQGAKLDSILTAELAFARVCGGANLNIICSSESVTHDTLYAYSGGRITATGSSRGFRVTNSKRWAGGYLLQNELVDIHFVTATSVVGAGAVGAAAIGAH